MIITKILQITDHLIFSQTKKHLDDLQKAVIEGTWQGQTYRVISENCQHSESRVRDVGYELWKLLSIALGENIKKKNFRATFERLNCESDSVLSTINDSNNHFYKTQNISQSNKQYEENITNNKFNYRDLILAPKIFKFYNRETELKTLSNWILNQNAPLISVLGLSKIGKSYLIRKFIDLNLNQFEVIVWRSLNFPKSLDLLINDLLTICKLEIKQNTQEKLNQLFYIFTQKRCLIILDDVQNIFISGQFAGQYQPEYKDYQKFFTMIIEVEHQSSIILISQEKCQEMYCLDQQLYPAKCLDLLGLDNIKFLDNTGLKNQDSWSQLIQLYEGNPGYLKDIISLIQDFYDGDVSAFLVENSLIITQSMQSYFNDLFNRMSSIEKQIILELIKLEKPISREELTQNLDLSSVDFIKGFQSLQQRYLVKKIRTNKILFELSLIFREYIRSIT